VVVQLVVLLHFFEVGSEPAAIALVQSIMNNLNQSAVYQQWPGGPMEGLLLHSALFDSSPLRTMFETNLLNLTVATSRTVCFGATDLQSGGYQSWCGQQSAREVIEQALASSAFPGILEAIDISGDAYVDGGVLVSVDVMSGIQECLTQGFTQQQILLDTVETEGMDFAPFVGNSSTITTIPIWIRAAGLRNYEDAEHALSYALQAFPGVVSRFHIYPSVPIPGTGFDFNPRMIKYMINLGESDAAYAISPTAENAKKQKQAQLDLLQVYEEEDLPSKQQKKVN